MKYVRTDNDKIVECKWVGHRVGLSIDEKYVMIVKQADNIEELIDEYVVVKTENPKITIPFIVNKYNTDFIKECIRMGNVIKGAIWTNEGLIYVAKMNDKGEFVLL